MVGWDGYFKSKLLSPDVFTYAIEIVFKNGETILRKGDITLVR
jgi:hypothetical protein